MMEMIAAYLQQTPVSSCNGRKHGKQRLALLRASVHKMIPSFSIMGISSEYEDMAKKIQSYSGDLEDQGEEIDSLVLQLSTICNQACEELVIEYNNKKTKLMKNEEKIKLFLVDDDAVFLKSLEIEFLQHTDFIVEICNG
jgi:NTP pyrophosphatase (non-canonical NTP hydrolase)